MGEGMKIKYDNDNIVIYLKGILIKDINALAYDISDKIKKYYNIDLKGFYKVNIYVDNLYGVVLEYIDEARDLYFNRLELNINKINTKFLYEVEDIFYFKINNIYLYNNKYYIDNYLENMEISNIVYKNTKNIKERAKKVSFCK